MHYWNRLLTALSSALLIVVICFSGCHQAAPDDSKVKLPQDMILQEVPTDIDTSRRYLFYLHGQIIEELGIRPTHPEWGVYEYEMILDSLKQTGAIVISEARPKGTKVKGYAEKVTGQIRDLLAAGVPGGNITIVGASKGAIITMLVSTYLKERAVNFVTIAACGDWVAENVDLAIHGNVLSIFEESDVRNGSCRELFLGSSHGINRFKEVKCNTGLGHGILYRPIKEWLAPTVAWMRGE